MPDSTTPQSSSSASPNSSKAGTYYDLLGIRTTASVQEIRRAYRDLSKLYHPDTTELESAIATPKFQALNEAYATLSSPEKRLAYDYKIGYSRISVMQPLSNTNHHKNGPQPYDPTRSAYISPTDRPLSAGELFALFILGVTFIGCLLLVFTIGLTRGDELTITLPAEPIPLEQTLPEPLPTPLPELSEPENFPSSEFEPLEVSSYSSTPYFLQPTLQ
ncbi:MAG: J domain-containing protein [Cyanobacteria bacterium J06632_3]